MRITVLGKSPSWPDAGGACSGYLVEHGATRLLLDCGNGVFGKLRRHSDYLAVDAVLISHLHADHFLDLVPYAYALTYAPRQQPVPVNRWPGIEYPVRPQLLLPPEGRDTMRALTSVWGVPELILDAFATEEFDPGGEVTVGELRLRFCHVPHYVATYAVSITPAAGGPRFVYGADCSPNAQISEFARDGDLVFLEGTLPRPERSGVRGHLTPGEAGEHARAAGARRLVIIHLSDELDALWARSEACRTFGGPVDIAREGAVYTV